MVMAKTKTEILSLFEKCGMIPVFYHPDYGVCKNVVDACYAGGLRIFEYANRGEKAAEVFQKLKTYVKTTYPDLKLGIGSIINGKQAEQFIALDADFIVAPILDESTAIVCHKANIFWVPGCGTLTEIAKAENLGAEIIKIFPGSVLGPEFIKAVKGPMPWLKLMPTGGVEPTKENLRAWLKAGAVCVGMGSQLISKKIIDTKNYQALTEQIKQIFLIIDAIKQEMHS
jgi:2-dehydro-3-deoxyphosphogluconate aldolase/(4S)-4-hydroxy-2-oxoglutarate aldolase